MCLHPSARGKISITCLRCLLPRKATDIQVNVAMLDSAKYWPEMSVKSERINQTGSESVL